MRDLRKVLSKLRVKGSVIFLGENFDGISLPSGERINFRDIEKCREKYAGNRDSWKLYDALVMIYPNFNYWRDEFDWCLALSALDYILKNTAVVVGVVDKDNLNDLRERFYLHHFYVQPEKRSGKNYVLTGNIGPLN